MGKSIRNEVIRLAIIDHFSNKPSDFINKFSKEFQREDSLSTTPEIYRYRNIMIKKLYDELSTKDSNLFLGIDKPLSVIEETLFEYINSNSL